MCFFSIVVPTYNRGKLLLNLIHSVLDQTYNDFELIIVDDGSTDATSQIITQFKDLRIHYYKIANSERSVARNFGLSKSRGKYINYFDSDDIMYCDRLHLIKDFIEVNSHPDVLYSYYDIIDSNGNKLIGKTKRVYESFAKDLLYNNFLSVNAVFLSRKVALNFLFDENKQLITAEDWELWLRIHLSHEFIELPRITFSMVEHQERSLRTASIDEIKNRDLYLIKCIDMMEYHKFYGTSAIDLFCADRYTFIALILAVNRSKVESLFFLLLSVRRTWKVLMRKRFWGVIKNLV